MKAHVLVTNEKQGGEISESEFARLRAKASQILWEHGYDPRSAEFFCSDQDGRFAFVRATASDFVGHG